MHVLLIILKVFPNTSNVFEAGLPAVFAPALKVFPNMSNLFQAGLPGVYSDLTSAACWIDQVNIISIIIIVNIIIRIININSVIINTIIITVLPTLQSYKVPSCENMTLGNLPMSHGYHHHPWHHYHNNHHHDGSITQVMSCYQYEENLSALVNLRTQVPDGDDFNDNRIAMTTIESDNAQGAPASLNGFTESECSAWLDNPASDKGACGCRSVSSS